MWRWGGVCGLEWSDQGSLRELKKGMKAVVLFSESKSWWWGWQGIRALNWYFGGSVAQCQIDQMGGCEVVFWLTVYRLYDLELQEDCFCLPLEVLGHKLNTLKMYKEKDSSIFATFFIRTVFQNN